MQQTSEKKYETKQDWREKVIHIQLRKKWSN